MDARNIKNRGHNTMTNKTKHRKQKYDFNKRKFKQGEDEL